MKINLLKNLTRAAFVVALLLTGEAWAQWNGEYGTEQYGNEWLAGKYGQKWLKISVSQRGIFKVSLTGDFVNKANKLHLYHRGKEVALLKSTDSEIEFYGVPNDGKSDELLYRSSLTIKDPAARDNPYFSMYSDVSAYFLTYDEVNGNRATQSNLVINESITAETYHIQTDVRVFTNEYSHSVDVNLVSVSNVQSYFESGRGLTGRRYGKHQTATIGTVLGDPIFNLQFKNFYFDQNVKAQAEILLYGRTKVSNNIGVFVGKDESSLRNINNNFNFTDFVSQKRLFDINPMSNINDSDVSLSGQGIVKLVTNNIGNTWQSTGLYSPTYLKFTYPQSFNLQGQTSELYSLIPSTNLESRLNIVNAPENCKIYDVTDQDVPKILNGNYSNSTLRVMVPRSLNKVAQIFVTSESVIDLTSKTQGVTFVDNNPSNFEYLIVSTKKLIVKPDETTSGVQLYKQYRESIKGGSFKTLLVDVADLYNHFNFGEPSPIAIRRFVDYMISKGVSSKHNLLLIGHSVTAGDKLKLTNIFRELVDEVPTIGYPGSDNLLVEGLGTTPQDVPSIPVGRITATTDEQVNNYLEKVKTYEADKSNLEWRKNVMHINGGVNPGESNTWSTNYYKGHLDGIVKGSPFLGNVASKQKAVDVFTNPLYLDITNEVNSGLGFISYFGHGNPHYTDNNIGYMSDSRRGYNNVGKYPVLYFNGCGVGNIFLGSTIPYPNNNTSDKDLGKDYISLSADWLLAPQKGAIAIIGNSYYAFESSSKDYLYALYDLIFKSNDLERLTIGQIHRKTASTIITGSPNSRVMIDLLSLSNTHQSNLQGDPALRILRTEVTPLPVELFDFRASTYKVNETLLSWKTVWEKDNGGFIVERSKDARQFESIGMVDGKGNSDREVSYSFVDTNPLPGFNYYRLKQVDRLDNSTVQKFAYSRIISIVVGDGSFMDLYPSPAIDELFIRIKSSSKLKSWVIRDISGKSVLVGTSQSISISQLPPSVYIMEATTTQGEFYYKKFIK